MVTGQAVTLWTSWSDSSKVFLLVSLRDFLGGPLLCGAGLGAGLGVGKMILFSTMEAFF